MLFYEPLFLFVFFPTFYLLYLRGERREALRRGVILGASMLFYAWSEPLFVPVVLASALADHLFARTIDRLPSGHVAPGQLLAPRRADQHRDPAPLQIHPLSDREPERAAAGHARSGR